VAQARQAREGATLEMAVGGKRDQWHGQPVRIRATVERLTDGRFKIEGASHFASYYGGWVEMGACAVVQCDGVRLLLTERKTPPGSLAQLWSQGIAPEAQKIIVVKSPVAFRCAYEAIAAEILEVDTPGLCTANLKRLPYRRLPQPVFPLDEEVRWSPAQGSGRRQDCKPGAASTVGRFTDGQAEQRIL